MEFYIHTIPSNYMDKYNDGEMVREFLSESF